MLLELFLKKNLGEKSKVKTMKSSKQVKTLKIMRDRSIECGSSGKLKL